MSKLNKYIKYALRSAAAIGLLLPGAGAHAEGSDMDWLGIAYLWGAGVDVDTKNVSAGVNFNSLIDNLEIAGMVHVEAQGDTFGGLVDVLFVGVGSNETRPNAHLNVDNDTTSMDLALLWSPGAERMTGFELYGGMRYVSNDFHLVVDPDLPALPTVTTGSDKSYTDLLVGARYITPLSDKWRLTFQGDLSGGDTEGTFSLGAYAGYVKGQHHFIVGYKHLEMDFESSQGRSLTVTMSGPMLAYGYRF